jgi:hypothetical protein
MDEEHLYILWTTDNLITCDKMIFMYAINSMRKGWWKNVTIIMWGAATKFACENELIQKKIGLAINEGIKITACKACADQLGVGETLETLGVEVKYWGEPLTNLLKNDEKIIYI